jgi:hypothetical protein
MNSLQQTFTFNDDDVENVENMQPRVLQEVTYVDNCCSHACFEHKKGDLAGYCRKYNVYILVELAKKQKICDYEKDKKNKR